MCCMLNKLEKEDGKFFWLAFTGMICPKLLQGESRRCEEDTLLREFPTNAAEEIPKSESSYCTLATNLGLTCEEVRKGLSYLFGGINFCGAGQTPSCDQ
jgi:hypothetical protein